MRVVLQKDFLLKNSSRSFGGEVRVLNVHPERGKKAVWAIEPCIKENWGGKMGGSSISLLVFNNAGYY